MKIADLSNDIQNTQVILWQYDQAVNLIALIGKWNAFSKASVTDFWDYFRDKILAIDTAEAFGLNVWGNLIGIPRPRIKVPNGSGGYVESSISDDLYRRLLKARFFMLIAKPTVPNFNTYLSILFPDTTRPTTLVSGHAQGYYPRNKVLDYGTNNFSEYRYDEEKDPLYQPTNNMAMGFTFPSSATQEEAYLIFQHYETVYQFPAAIRNNCAFVQTDMVIGLNNTESDGQNYRNFANAFAFAEDDTKNGGILSNNEGANYKVNPTVTGNVYIVNISADNSTDSITFAYDGTVWLDWGDGDSNYRTVTNGGTVTHTYAQKGLYAVAVYSTASSVVGTKPAKMTAEYAL